MIKKNVLCLAIPNKIDGFMTLNNLPFSHPYGSYNKNNMHNDEGEYAYI